MYKDSISKLVPNRFNENYGDEDDYVKPEKIKAQVKDRAVRTPLQDRGNKLASFKNNSMPVKVQIEIPEEENEDGSTVIDPKPEENLMVQVFTQTSFPIPKNVEESKKDEMKLEFRDMKDVPRGKGSILITSKSKSKKPKKSLEEIFQQRKLNIVRTAFEEKNKRIFNLELSDSENEKEHQKELDQDKAQDFKYINNVNCRQNQLKNIFDQNTPIKRTQSKFQVNVSGDSEEEKPKEEMIVKPKERSKFILNKFDSDSSEEEREENGQKTNDKSNQRIENEEYEQQLEVVRNMNVLKLKTHFQYIRIDNNFLSFCPIPAECKTSLIVKRNTEKSQYLVFDSELVSQVMKVQKSLGGVYKFSMVKDGSSKEGKPELREIGKMKSNFLGTQFHCYAYREEDKKEKKQKYQCASIKYEMNILGLNGPRKVKIYAAANPIPSSTDLLQTFESNPALQPEIKVYQSKTPKWMPELNAYVLNLRGTASHSSIKNCIIVDSQNENKQHLIFGKKSKDIFNLEIKSPFTVLQGVAFAVSSFQRKLACE